MTGTMRKYGKYILVVVGVLCMLVFVGNFGSGRNAGSFGSVVRGRLDGKKVTNFDIESAENSYRILDIMQLTMGLGQRLSETNRPLHWYLLLQEGRRNGVTATVAEVNELMANFQITEQSLPQILALTKSTEKSLRTALADYITVNKLISAAVTSVPVSLPQLEHIAADTRTTVQVAYAKNNASRSLVEVPEPTEEQIKKQFELYKGAVADPTKEPPLIDGHRYPFGYKYPDRVQVEFITFDRAAIRAATRATPEDVVAALREYEANPMAFPADVDEKEKNKPATEGPTTEPKPAFKSFEEVKTKLVDKQIDARVSQILAKMVARAQASSMEPWKTAKIDDKGFREPVPSEKWSSYKAIAEDIQAQRDFGKYLPTVSAPGNWLTFQTLRNLTGIGDAVIEVQRSYVPFNFLATGVRELKGEDPTLTRFHLQVGVDGIVKQVSQLGVDGNVYLYRVTKAEKSHEPASLDEVRAAVVDDLKKLARFKKLEAEAQLLAQAAQTQDLAPLAAPKGFLPGETPAFSRLSEGFSRRQQDFGTLSGVEPTVVRGLENVPNFVSAAFELAGQKAPATKPAKWAPTSTVSSESSLEIVVLKLVNYTPCPINTYEEERPYFQRIALATRRQEFLATWISLEAMAARLHYVPEGGKLE